MKIGIVIGNVWATKKDDSLSGYKLMIVRMLPPAGKRPRNSGGEEEIVAIDTIGAGTGDTVIISHGSSARYLYGKSNTVPIDAAIVGIVDQLDRADI